MRRRQPEEPYGPETTWDAPLDEQWDDQASIVDTIFLSGAPPEGEPPAENGESTQAAPRKRTLLTQALLIKESPQKPAAVSTGEPSALLIRGAAKPPRPS